MVLDKQKIVRRAAALTMHAAKLLFGKLISAPKLMGVGIRSRVIISILVICSLTVLAGVIAVKSYGHIGNGLLKIENEGIAATRAAVSFSREKGAYADALIVFLNSKTIAELEDREASLIQAGNQFLAAVDQRNGVASLDTIETHLDDLKFGIDSLQRLATRAGINLRQLFKKKAQVASLLSDARREYSRSKEVLAPILDDAAFRLLLGLKSTTHSQNAGISAGFNIDGSQKDARSVMALTDIETEIEEILGLYVAAALSPNSTHLSLILDKFVSHVHRINSFKSISQEIVSWTSVQEQIERLLSVGTMGGNIFDERRAELTILDSMNSLRDRMSDGRDALTEIVSEIVDDASDRTQLTISNVRGDIGNAVYMLLSTIVLSLIFSGVYAWIYLGNGLVRRISELKNATVRLAHGDLDVDIPNGGDDEVTQMAASLELFKSQAISARTHEVEKEKARLSDLKGKEAAFRFLFKGNPVPMLVFERCGNTIVAVNRSATSHYGFTRDQLIGNSILKLNPAHESKAKELFVSHMYAGTGSSQCCKHATSSGQMIDVAIFSSRMIWEGKDCNVVAMVDVTDRNLAQERASHLANHDALTGLANRIQLYDRLNRTVVGNRKNDHRTLAILCMDLDKFKEINDKYGHSAGDAVLIEVANRLSRAVRKSDTVARLGGDEFAIVVEDWQGDYAPAIVAERIISSVSEPIEIDSYKLSVGATIGIASAPNDGMTTEELMKNADIALYRAKNQKRGSFCFFQREMGQRLREQRKLEEDLKGAVENDDLFLEFQPIVNLKNDKVVAFEALIRWQHSVDGIIPPGKFIPLAEETGIISEIGNWAMEAACREATQWPSDVNISVNLSAHQFKGGKLTKQVEQILSKTGMDASRLILEITESAVLGDTNDPRTQLHILREMGCVIALDDFGTGYSALSYLRSMPIDTLKIDRSFVTSLFTDKKAANIFRTVIELAKNLEMTTVAEGIETIEQRDFVASENCDYMQGYLFSRPVRAKHVDQFFTNSSSIILDGKKELVAS